MADGKTESAFHFTSFEEADLFADDVRSRKYVEDVQVLRAGRHPSSKKWAPTRRSIKSLKAYRDYGVTVNEEAWVIPPGYVDGDADKHGPAVFVPVNQPARSDKEKSEWAKNNKFDNRTCLWQ